MSLLDRINALRTQAGAPAPAPETPKPPPEPIPESRRLVIKDVVEAPAAPAAPAPTAPAVAPTVKADHEPAPEAPKRGPGRPPGSRNKPKPTEGDFEAPATAAAALVPEMAKGPAKVTINRVAVRHGLTINLGNYQSARVEVELEAVGPGADNFREEVSRLVKDALEKEAAPYLGPAAGTEKK